MIQLPKPFDAKQISCNTEMIQDLVKMNSRGGITRPTRMREAFKLKADDQLIMEERPQGLLIRPAISVPIEIYTDEHIAEFIRDDDAIGKLLDQAAVKR